MMDTYEAIAAASGRMLAAARAGDWDGLLAAEGECTALISRLQEQSADPEATLLGTGQQRRKAEILRRVLADDAEIRDRLHPWMRRLEELIGGARQGRRMQQGYGA